MGPQKSRKDGEPKRRRAEKTAIAKKMALHIEPKKRRADRTAIAQYDGISCQAEGTAIRKDGSRQRKKGMTDDKIHAEGAVGLKQEQK